MKLEIEVVIDPETGACNPKHTLTTGDVEVDPFTLGQMIGVCAVICAELAGKNNPLHGRPDEAEVPLGYATVIGLYRAGKLPVDPTEHRRIIIDKDHNS